MVKAPDWLDRHGRTYWRKLSPLIEMNDSTGELLAVLCDLYSHYRLASEQLKEQGVLIKSGTGSGFMRKNPACDILDRCQAGIARYSKLLGLVATQATNEVDELENILGGT